MLFHAHSIAVLLFLLPLIDYILDQIEPLLGEVLDILSQAALPLLHIQYTLLLSELQLLALVYRPAHRVISAIILYFNFVIWILAQTLIKDGGQIGAFYLIYPHVSASLGCLYRRCTLYLLFSNYELLVFALSERA